MGNRLEKFLLPLNTFKDKHTAIVGITGSGKSHLVKIITTALIKMGWVVLILDEAVEHSDLCQFFPPDVLMVVDPRDLKINFLIPPPNVDQVIWRGVLIGIFRESFFFRDGTCNELNSIISNLQNTRIYPTFPDLYKAIMSKSYRAGSRRAEYIESLQNRAEMLLDSYITDALMCVDGHPLTEVLIKKSCVLEVGRISDDLVRNFYVNYILEWIKTYLTYNPQDR